MLTLRCAASATNVTEVPSHCYMFIFQPYRGRPLTVNKLRSRKGTVIKAIGRRWKAQSWSLSHSLPHMWPIWVLWALSADVCWRTTLIYYCKYLSHHTHIRTAVPLSLGSSSFCAWWYLLWTTEGIIMNPCRAIFFSAFFWGRSIVYSSHTLPFGIMECMLRA
jgi:hypothetical protein